MIYNQTQSTLNTLSRPKVVTDKEVVGQAIDQNRIASILEKPDYERTKEEKEDLTVSVVEDMIQKGENKDLINKIAAVTSKSNKQKGEVAELQSLLNAEDLYPLN